MKRTLYLTLFLYAVSIASGGTTVSIDGTQWHINGKITCPCTAAEGLLMNVRMVNSTFEDRKRPDFDSDKNTGRFVSKIPEYNSYGVRAFTLNLQGGFPGYEGAVNSAFRPDGTLRKKSLGRIKRVIEECDKRGMVVILGLFYQRQDQILQDEQAVKIAVVNAVNWVKDSGFTNVAIEIANEYDHGGFDHDIIKTAEGEVELIRLVKKTVPGMLVSASGLGHGRMNDLVAKEADFILIHFNGTKVIDIPGRIGALKKYNKPIVCNEDDKVGDEAVQALRVSVDNGCSWGFMHKNLNQYEPFEFNGYNDDQKVYDKFKQVTTR
ncbi:MAG: hypothetical protein JXA81_03475 [Sedimentisphaerales bacterium]|nr:hypothetical protein [Sedimentisphaerales bacterium]